LLTEIVHSSKINESFSLDSVFSNLKGLAEIKGIEKEKYALDIT